ncbi:gliding motility protein GldM [Flavobacterium sp. RHBU_3]|uniref:type IX secretion system motor protein PorM/GldM n=1 Tax=Flavobacterium sp. RHBU_3 TaxID=3391184 RepID=UPI00398521BE
MAGGKLTPRQKMVNLMYLVFIAMMALNMSKEVLSAFGLMNEKFEASNKGAVENNEGLFQALSQKATDDPSHYGEAKKLADQVKTISADFYAYIETLKGDITKDIEKEPSGKLPFEQMDKGDKIDEAWFAGDGYSNKGKEVLGKIEGYRNAMIALLKSDKKYAGMVSDLEYKFNTADVKAHDGAMKKYLDYNFKGFPAIASLTKLSAMQNDVKSIEAAIYSGALGKAALAQASMKNFTALVVLDKNAYFEGEKVTGKVVLGKYDENTKPTSFQGPGKIENGQAVLNFNAAGVGEHDINGKFVFTEEGKSVPLDFKGQYVVVPRPNSATVSADKMNSVYRGVVNPMTISFAGVSDKDVTVNAQGLTKGSKTGQYNWSVTNLPGETAVVTVTAKLPDGKTVSDKKTFVIRDIPRPIPTIRGKEGNGKGSKEDLSVSEVKVAFPGFVFDVQTVVKSFELQVPGSPRMKIQGNRFDSAAKAAIAKARKGDVIIVGSIQCDVVGAGGYKVKESTSFAWEVQ